MKAALRQFTFWSLLAGLVYTLGGCSESTIVGQNLVPSIDNIHTFQTDTFSVRTRTVQDGDSSISSNRNSLLVGAINTDPQFGRSTAIGYFQLGLPSNEFSFRDSLQTIDSLVLSLAYKGYYGDSLASQQFTAYRILDPGFNDTTAYYTFQQFAIDLNNPLGTVIVTPQSLEDSVMVDSLMQAPQLRIRLSQALGQEFLQQSSSAAFYNDSAFHHYFRGIALVPDSGSAGRSSLILLDMTNGLDGMTVYYSTPAHDSLSAFFPFSGVPSGGDDASSDYIHRDYSSSEVAMHLNNTSVSGDSLLYLQSSPGLHVDLDIPYLQQFPNALINQAQLILTQIPDPGNSYQTFQAPPQLFLWKYSKNRDSLNYIFDAGLSYDPTTGSNNLTNATYFGGHRQYITNAQGIQVAQYRFNITRYMQHLISDPYLGETNYGFRVVVQDPQGLTTDQGRVVVGGGTHSQYALKLQVTYTKIK